MQGEIEDDQIEPLRLEEPFATSQGLVLGTGADPEQALEVAARGSGRNRVEGIGQIDPGGQGSALQRLGEQAEGESGPARGGRSVDLAETALGKPPAQERVEWGEPRRTEAGGLGDVPGKGAAVSDPGAEIGEQGLECAASFRAGDRSRGAGFVRPANPTKSAHGTTCPSDRGVGRRGGHARTFAFCSLKSRVG